MYSTTQQAMSDLMHKMYVRMNAMERNFHLFFLRFLVMFLIFLIFLIVIKFHLKNKLQILNILVSLFIFYVLI